jgi:release factor glutamine methyltransferase
MTSWLDLQREAAKRLAEAGVDCAAHDARRLVEIASGLSGVELVDAEQGEAPAAAIARMKEIIARRIAREPVSRIRGWRSFFGRRFIVTPDVLDPRPDTEVLVAEAVARLPDNGQVLDLGTGSGAILLSILAEREDVSGVGLDISVKALEVATRNAQALGLTERARFMEGSWEAAPKWPWDMIVANPPYITDDEMKALEPDVADYDPHLALAGGADGLDPYRVIAPVAFARLSPGGWIGLEHGSQQSGAVLAILQQAGFEDLSAFSDFSGHVRAAFGRRPG